MKIRFKDYVKVGAGLGFGLCLGKHIYNFTGDVVSIAGMTVLHGFVEAGLITDERLVRDVNEYWSKMHPEKKKEEQSEE
jgi:hypothetical protein